MNRAARLPLAVLLGLAACSSASPSTSTPRSGGTLAGTGGLSATGGASGTGGRTGSGGSASTGGSAATGGSVSIGDAGVVDGGRPDAIPPRDGVFFVPEASSLCHVVITAVPPGTLMDIPPGPSQTLQVRGQIVWGTQAPFTPEWSWKVIRSDGATLTPVILDDATTVQIPIAVAGRYDITANIGQGCAGSTHALAYDPAVGNARYALRVIPPGLLGSELGASPACGSGAACPTVDESEVKVVAGSPTITRDVTLSAGTEVLFDPITVIEGSIQVAVPSMIRIQPTGSTWKTFGNTNALGPFRAILDPVFEYQVLVVPDTKPPFADLPPYLLSRESTNGIKITAQYLALLGQTHSLIIGPGLTIAGKVTAQGQPVARARVVLQSGWLFSVGGETDEQGDYRLNVNPGGVFSISIVPPDDAPWLATATIDQGIVLTDPDIQVPPMDFDWTVPPLTEATLHLRWRNGTPKALQGCTVLVESLPGALPDAGTLNVTGVFPASLGGQIRLAPAPDADGIVHLPPLPLLKYQVTVAPPASLPETAVSTFLLDLTRPGNGTIVDLPLDEKVPVLGRLVSPDPALLAAAVGTQLTATDLEATPFPLTLTTTLSATGTFTFLDASPGRTYSLRAYPPPGKGFPEQLHLVGFTTTKGTNVLDDQPLPRGIPIRGKVSFANGLVDGALVQLFCIGALPDCLSPSEPTLGSPQALAQARSKLDGTYELWVADPGPAR